jgi:hypothetical protein
VKRLAFLVALAACGGDDGTNTPPSIDAPANAASTMFTWTIQQNGLPATCSSAHADEIRITATSEGGIPTDHTFQCVLTPGSLSLPAGRYAITADLYDSTGPQKLATVASQAVTVPSSATVTFAFSF